MKRYISSKFLPRILKFKHKKTKNYGIYTINLKIRRHGLFGRSIPRDGIAILCSFLYLAKAD